jgi:hypothetical protein
MRTENTTWRLQPQMVQDWHLFAENCSQPYFLPPLLLKYMQNCSWRKQYHCPNVFVQRWQARLSDTLVSVWKSERSSCTARPDTCRKAVQDRRSGASKMCFPKTEQIVHDANKHLLLLRHIVRRPARGNVDGWCAVLQAGRPRDRVLTRSLHFFLQFTSSFQLHHGSEIRSALNRNSYQNILLELKRGNRVGLTT